ncbi:nickel pincer cofactor biosynthesis protein LarB [bacterium]|nr:nickel pincer cofactor biosynthesis protein LarB [bacterium]
MWVEEIKHVLEAVRAEKMTIDQALEKFRHLPFEDLGFAKIDHHRAIRKGFPEVIFGQGKRPEMILKIIQVMVQTSQNILVTRCEPDVARFIQTNLPAAHYDEIARILYLKNDETCYGQGTIAVISAGTLDLPVAEEAALTAELMGNTVERIFDVGVAGIHRLFAHKNTLTSLNVAIVVAGMEGALPSVVGGLINRPVIAVPTSIGYGASFGGISALLGMLNSCASGVVVVNIDNGFGAAYAASLINRKPGTA